MQKKHGISIADSNITPASGFVDPLGALVIGIVGGAACYWGATKLKQALGYDDSLDAFGVHGIGGIVGALLTGVFAVEAIGGTPGVLEGNITQLWTQFVGILATIIYSAVVTFIILKIIKALLFYCSSPTHHLSQSPLN